MEYIPPILNRHVSRLPDSDLFKGLNREDKMLIRRVTMASTLSREAIIRRTEISNSDNDRGSRNTPPEVLHTAKLKAGTADLSAFKQRLAEPHSGHAIACLH